MPDRFVVARHTFVDFGPPLDYYDLYVVRPASTGSYVQKISLTPPGAFCRSMPKMEVQLASLPDSPAELLGPNNPCAVPEKEFRREAKRCKHCLVFSGAHVAMQVTCGDQIRIIRSNILDRDMFDPHADTPHETSWTMRLLARLDKPLGPGVMEKPIFSSRSYYEGNSSTESADPEVLAELKSGKFDALFADAPDKPSQLYAQAEAPPPPAPTVTLVSSKPFPPDVYVAPAYPLIAQAAHIEGRIAFTIEIDSKGVPGNASLITGSKYLFSAVNAAVAKWRFQEPVFNQQIHVTLNYALNCPDAPNRAIPHTNFLLARPARPAVKCGLTTKGQHSRKVHHYSDGSSSHLS
jgi:hypothetical protein